MSEHYRFYSSSGQELAALPTSARPTDHTLTYDLQTRAGVWSQTWHLEGTGQAQPSPLTLTLTVRAASQAAAEAEIRGYIGAARQAASLGRDGLPDRVPLLGLQSAQWRPLASFSGMWELSLTLLPAAPGQTGGTVTVPGSPAPPATGGTASLTLTVQSSGGPAFLTVSNITTGGTVFSGTLAGSYTIPGLVVGHQFRGVPGDVAGYTTPTPKTTTLPSSGTTMTFAYVASGTPPPGTTPPPDTGVY